MYNILYRNETPGVPVISNVEVPLMSEEGKEEEEGLK